MENCLCHLSFRTHNRKQATAEAMRSDPARLNVVGALARFAELLLRGGQT